MRAVNPGNRGGNNHSYLELASAVEPFAALFAIAAQGVENDRVRFGGGAYFVHFHGLAFQLLVILKKTAQHERPILVSQGL